MPSTGAPQRAPQPEPVEANVAAETEAETDYLLDIAARTEAVLAFETLGTIIERPVDVGDEVTAGQVLARLDPDDLQADVSAARAALASAAFDSPAGSMSSLSCRRRLVATISSLA